MKLSRYHLEFGTTSACSKRLVEETKGLRHRALKGSKRDFFLFGSWFLSKKPAEEAASVGVDFIGMVKNNTKGFCKSRIEGLTKYWPGRSYIVMKRKPMVPGERRLLGIGYKYNYRKVLSFVAAAGSGKTTLGITYLSKYPDQFLNVSIRPVSHPLLMSKFFGSVNEVDSKKSPVSCILHQISSGWRNVVGYSCVLMLLWG